MRLIEALLKEARVPKAIIMGGGAGAGKTHVTQQFVKLAEENGWNYLNPDTYARNPNKEERLPLAKATAKINQELEASVTSDAKPNIVWDTTAGNPNNVVGVQKNGYQVMMIMVYSHPMASFQSNFARAGKEGEEAIPAQGVFATWLKSYNPELINTYKKAFNENFMLVDNTSKPGIDMKLIQDFNKAVESGPVAMQNYVDNLIKAHPDKYTQTQFEKKGVQLPTDVQKDFESKVAEAGITFKTAKEEEKLKKAALDFYTKKNEFMPAAKLGRVNGLVEKLEAIRKSEQKAQENKKVMYQELHKALATVIEADTTMDEAIDRAKQFIQS